MQNPALERPALKQQAQQEGIVLNPDTIQMLEGAKHSAHIKPIAEVGMAGQWNRALVEARSERLCDIVWSRLWPWLQ